MICEQCGGSGFVSTDRNGYSYAAPCSCRPQKMPEPELTIEEISTVAAEAVRLMSGMIPFFPQGEIEHAFITSELISWTEGRLSDLRRITHFACTNLKKWEGLAALWEAYENRLEAAFAAAVIEDNARQLDEYRRAYLNASRQEQRAIKDAQEDVVKNLALAKSLP